MASRRKSRASRRGARHSWFQPGLPPLQPQLERQRSTPWTQLQEVSSATSASHCGREFFEELAVVGEVGLVAVFDPVHGVGERHLAVLVMVAVAFAVGGDVGELGASVVGGGGMEAGEQAAGEVFAAVEEAFEGDGAGVGAVVEEDGDAAAFVELDEVGVGGVDGGVGGFGPGRFDRTAASAASGRAADGARLMGMRRTRAHWTGARMVNLMPSCGHEVEDAAVDGGLGEPHAFGLAVEAGLEVGDAPADLGEGVAACWRAA